MTDSPITVLLIHGGGASGWDWHLVAPLLREYGYEVLAPDLPIEDPETGIAEYADFLAAELGDAERVVVVAHSYGGLVAPVLAARRPVEQLILVSAMIPAPGEAPNEWWSKSGYDALGLELPMETEEQMVAAFLHDVPAELAAEELARGREQVEDGDVPVPLDAWPDVPTRFLLCRDDRFFPADFVRTVVRERLGIDPDEIDGSHGVMLSRPRELADRVNRYVTSWRASPGRS
ncbi:alpha/beta fold hydrolase [Nocardia jiangsuensis]|uniref:Alpha/beta fold hydrolase n=1 Tax=Nocardia jiangsuensis TaxID=1691563 RepID=A0ABV8DZY4_9NOCA